MIDWFGLGATALWIFGGALGLAAVSQAHWQASRGDRRFRDQLGSNPYQTALLGAGFLFCLGQGFSSRQLSLTTTLWLLLALAFLANLILLLKKHQ